MSATTTRRREAHLVSGEFLYRVDLDRDRVRRRPRRFELGATRIRRAVHAHVAKREVSNALRFGAHVSAGVERREQGIAVHCGSDVSMKAPLHATDDTYVGRC